MKTVSIVLLALMASAWAQDCDVAPVCDESVCNLPDCVCSNTVPDIPLRDRPMIVYLTFDDAMTKLASDDFYSQLFDGSKTNPDGCPIRATHFLTHLYTDYSLVNKYWRMGHEMASHSITHRANATYWKTLSKDGWANEMSGMKTITKNLANIPEDQIRGVRAPYLQGGGDSQFQMMLEDGFEYDCTMPSRNFGYLNMANGRWPFTYNYRSEMDCQIEPCPKCSYDGIWSQPILDLDDAWLGSGGDPEHGSPCGMLDSCICPECDRPKQIADMIIKNFDIAYNGNTRAPFGLYVHAAWFFGQPFHFEGYLQAVEYMLSKNDTFFVPIHAGIQYRQNPVPLQTLIDGQYEPFKCPTEAELDPTDEYTCTNRQSCRYQDVENEDLSLAEIYMVSCNSCPSTFPWLGNPEGNA
ncbi:hypothetical protein TCAL_11804 [Tigriopus californicus]|uniref:NodB homology domain-containing protein n=1 Tax=Tigriopus californicus TaxID=6832 RepID=A0A553PM85_TIGCA|nr:chitin deacetylase 7-like [Tigriopus californicus]TRY78789.1 hypothetical protein TCAL_11804 [Tigriopus californicus]|eukprot:TCALIF_11804-PA protein Name:"Protein of unknown function" AED:0.05 eAED:0.05 QI:157/1/1/1/0.83/0.85/7/65/409